MNFYAYRMKTAIVFLCFLAVCDVGITSETNTTKSNQTEQSFHKLFPSTTNVPSVPATDLQTPTPSCPTPPVTTPASAYHKLFSVNHLFLFALGLMLACTILLISTFLLAWKVCQLSRRLKMLSGDSDLVIPAKICTGNNKSSTDAKETTVLMSDLNETRDGDGDGGNGPETEKDVCENGVEQKEKGAKNEEVKEAPAAAAEDSSSPNEEGGKSQVEKSESTPTSEEAKDGE